MNFNNSNKTYLTYNTNPFSVGSSPSLDKIQIKRGKALPTNYKKGKNVISPYNNKFVAFVGLLGTPSKGDHVDRTKGVVPLVSQEGLCYVHDDNDDQSNIQLKRCNCTLCICDSEIKTNLKCSKSVQAEINEQENNSGEEKAQSKPPKKQYKKLRNKYQNDLEIWNALESSVNVQEKTNISAANTTASEETDSTFSDYNNKNKEGFQKASISVEKSNNGKIKCKYIINGKQCYRLAKCGKAWRIEIYSKNDNRKNKEASKERDVEEGEEKENIRYGSNKKSFDSALEEALAKKFCRHLGNQSGSSTETTSLDDVLPFEKSNVTTVSLPVVQIYPNKSNKQSTQTTLPYLLQQQQQSSILDKNLTKSSKDLRNATGQLTNGVVPNQLRAYIYNSTNTNSINEKKTLPFNFENIPSSSSKKPNLAIYAYPYSESCSQMLDELLESDKNELRKRLTNVLSNNDSNCQTIDMIKALQEKIEAHEKACPKNVDTIAAIKELEKKVEELQQIKVIGKSVVDKSTDIPEKIELSCNKIAKKDVSSQTLNFNEEVLLNKASTEINDGEVKEFKQEICPPFCYDDSSISNLKPKATTQNFSPSCDENPSNNINLELPQAKALSVIEPSIATCCETSSTDTCPTESFSMEEPQNMQTSSLGCSTDVTEFQPKLSTTIKAYPAIYQDEDFVKVIHERIKKYVKTCPSSCYNNSLIKVLQSKIEVLEKSVPQYNSKRRISEDTFGLSEFFGSQPSKQILLSNISNTNDQLHRRLTVSSISRNDETTNTIPSDIFGMSRSEKIKNRKPTPYLYYQFAPSITLIATEKESETSQIPEAELTPDEELQQEEEIPPPPPPVGSSSKKNCCSNDAILKALQDKVNEYENTCPTIKMLTKKVERLEKALPIAAAKSSASECTVKTCKDVNSTTEMNKKSPQVVTKNVEEPEQKLLMKDTATGYSICEKKSNISLCKTKTNNNAHHHQGCDCCSCANTMLDKKKTDPILSVTINTSNGKDEEPEMKSIQESNPLETNKLKRAEENELPKDEGKPKSKLPIRKNGNAPPQVKIIINEGAQTDNSVEEVYRRPLPKKNNVNTASATDDKLTPNKSNKGTTIEDPISQTAEVQTNPPEEEEEKGNDEKSIKGGEIDQNGKEGGKPKVDDTKLNKKQPSKIPVLKNNCKCNTERVIRDPCDDTTCKKKLEPCCARVCKNRHHTNIPQIFKNPSRSKLKPPTETVGCKIRSPAFRKKYEGFRSKLRPPTPLKTIFSNKSLDKNECCSSKVIKNLQNKIDALEKSLPPDIDKCLAIQDQISTNTKGPPDFCNAIKDLHEKVEALEKNYQRKPNKKTVTIQKCASINKCHQKNYDKANYYQKEIPKGESTSSGVYKVEIPLNENPIENMLKNVVEKQDSISKIDDQNYDVTSSKSQKIKSFFKKKFKQAETGPTKANVCLETSSSSFIRMQTNSKDNFENKQQQQLIEELGMQRNELRELKTLLQSHISQIERCGKYKNINTTILHRAMVYEDYSKPYESNYETSKNTLLGIEAYNNKDEDGFEELNNKLITLRPYKNHKSSQTNFEKSHKLKIHKDNKSSQTNFEKTNNKLKKKHRNNKSSQTNFKLYKENKSSLTDLGSYKLFKSYSGKLLRPQEAKSQSCPDCHKRKKCKVKEYSKSEIIQSQEEKKKMSKGKNRKRKKLWILMLCKFCFCR